MIHYDPSVRNFISSPHQYRLVAAEGALSATQRKAGESLYDHTITRENLHVLISASMRDTFAKTVVEKLRTWEVKKSDESFFGSFFRGVSEYIHFRKEQITALETDLATWCEEVIDNPEYASRVEASRKIREAFVTRDTKLDLSNLQLTRLPDSICDLTSLTRLEAMNNSLRSLPAHFDRLTALETLNFEKNAFESFPEEIIRMTQIKDLNLARNRIPTVPASISTMVHLVQLNLCKNLINALPEEMGELPQLRHLFLKYNALTTIPARICNLSSLTYLHLGANQITSLPEEISRLQNLKRLQLENNRLTVLPNGICDLRRLIELHVETNFLTRFPERFFNLSNLTVFTYEGNPLEEQPAFLSLPKLEDPIINQIRFWTLSSKLILRKEAHTGSVDSFYSSLISHPRADELKVFLNRLTEMKDYKTERTKSGIIDLVVSILNLAVENETFRDKMFDILFEASSRCGDRVTAAFNDISGLYAIYEAIDPAKDPEGVGLANVLIGLERKGLLDNYSLSYAIRHGLGDQVEVALFFQVKCKTRLGLPVKIQDMLYPSMASIRAEDEAVILRAAVKHVKDATTSNEQLLEILSKNDHWIARIKALNSAEFSSIESRFHAQLENLEENNDLEEGKKLEMYREIPKAKEAADLAKVRELTTAWLVAHPGFLTT